MNIVTIYRNIKVFRHPLPKRSKRMSKLLFSHLFILALLNTAFAQNTTVGTMEQIGTSMANFLKIGIGAREVAMGGAAVADCDNASALFWNPGALDRMQKNEVLIQQTQWLVNTQLYFLGAGFKVSGIGSFGVSDMTGLMTKLGSAHSTPG